MLTVGGPKRFRSLKNINLHKKENIRRDYGLRIVWIYTEKMTRFKVFFYVGRPTDYKVDSISLPSTTSTDPMGKTWSVNVGNLGYDSTSSKAQITAQIFRNQTQWFDETIDIAVLPDNKETVFFTKPFKPLFTGKYEVMVVVKHPDDNDNLNDTVWKTVNVQIGKDVLVDAMSRPNQNEVFYINDRVDSSTISIRNQGLDDLSGVRVFTKWVFEKAILFQSSDTLDLNADSTWRATLATQIEFITPGKGYYQAWVEHKDDEDSRNDTLIHYYEGSFKERPECVFCRFSINWEWIIKPTRNFIL